MLRVEDILVERDLGVLRSKILANLVGSFPCFPLTWAGASDCVHAWDRTKAYQDSRVSASTESPCGGTVTAEVDRDLP